MKYCSYNNPVIKYFKSYIHYLPRSCLRDSTRRIHHAFTLSTSREDAYYRLFLWLCIMPYPLCAPWHLFRIIFFSLPASSHQTPYRVCIFSLEEAARFSHSCIEECVGTLIRIRLFQFFKIKLFTSISRIKFLNASNVIYDTQVIAIFKFHDVSHAPLFGKITTRLVCVKGV